MSPRNGLPDKSNRNRTAKVLAAVPITGILANATAANATGNQTATSSNQTGAAAATSGGSNNAATAGSYYP